MSLFSSPLCAARLACFLGLEVGGKLLWEIFKLHRSFASGLCLMAVHSSQEQAVRRCCGVWEPLRRCVLLPFVLHSYCSCHQTPGECG